MKRVFKKLEKPWSEYSEYEVSESIETIRQRLQKRLIVEYFRVGAFGTFLRDFPLATLENYLDKWIENTGAYTIMRLSHNARFRLFVGCIIIDGVI